MIKKNTVFVLGAGASSDFNYPLGDPLRQKIIQGFISNHSQTYKDIEILAKALNNNFPNEFKDYIPKINEFANKLKLDGGYSIDEFLERFPKSYLLIGKLAIALILVRYEKPDEFYDSDNWYRRIYERMRQDASIDTFGQNQVSFITFNYDRSLEHFLHTALLRFSENTTENYVNDIINQIPIVHIYGKLDFLPWQDSGGRSYGSPITIDQLRKYKKNISIIFENITEETNSNFQKAIELLNQAERIYLLGFGFHPVNFSKLKLGEITLNKKIIATSYKLEPRAINSIRPLCKGTLRSAEFINEVLGYAAGINFCNMNVYDFVKELINLNLLD